MAKLNRKAIYKLQNEIAHDQMTFWYLVYTLKTTYRIPARKAKVLAKKIEKEGCDYWLGYWW